MKKRRISGIIIGICLLLGGCGTDNENMDIFRPDQQMEEAVTASPLEDGESGKDVEQAMEDTGSGNEIEQTAEEEEKEEASAEETLWTGGYTRAYRRFLEGYVEEENEYAHRARVMLALIDSDNIPELLLVEDNSHASGVKVYTYYQGSVVELGEFGSFGSMQYVERGGMIFSGYSGMGVGSSQFFQMENGEAKLVCSMISYQPFDGSPETYEIDGISATEEAFQKKWEELYDADEYIAIGYDDGLNIWELELTDLLTEAKDALFLQKDSPGLTEMVAEQSEVLEGYGTFLAEYVPHRVGSEGKEVPGFALIYLDGDETPELIVIEGYAHACGASVYTYEKGEVILIGEYGQYGAMVYREKEGIVFGDYETGDKMIDYGMCRTLTGSSMQSALTEELENLILTQEEVLKQNMLIAAGAPESKILLLDYDDYDRDGKYEAFMICGDSYDEYGAEKYQGALCFAGANCCTLLRNYQHYRMIDGKMELGQGRKFLFFYTDDNFTANISELWTVEDGKPVESKFSQIGQVVYRGGNDFEIWMDTYDHFYDTIDEMWSGHTWKPYFYHYNYSSKEIEAYGGEVISGKKFEELSGTNLIEEIEAEGYTVETIIWWENDIATINYVIPEDDLDCIVYENVIWDNKVKDFWEKDVRGVTSWKNAGEGGNFQL